jgi:hypothetical protein
MKMIAWLEAPVPPRTAAIAALLMLAGGGLYCSLYNGLQDVPESPLVGAGWAAINLLPWLGAFELSKRAMQDPAGRLAGEWGRIALILAAAASVSLGLDVVGRPIAKLDAQVLAFEALRRLPAAALVLLLLLLASLMRRRDPAAASANLAGPEAADRLPLLPRQIDWIKAAGNYLEFRTADGGVTLRRMTMSEAEVLLAREGFVRIHRSALVNRDKVARLVHGKVADEVKLADGTWLKVGGAYRSHARLRLNGGGGRRP